MGIRISIVITITAFVSYQHIINNLEQQTLDKLEKYITERAQKESSIFILAEDNHRLFRKHFLEIWSKRYDSPAEERFHQLFETYNDGTVRLKQNAYTGMPRLHASEDDYLGESRWISGFVGLNTPINDKHFQNRLLLAYDLVDKFAEGWSNRFANTYVSLPEGANIVYWPNLNWAKGATAELDIPKEEWVYIANKENNPERESVWTGLYYDQTADEWMVSCETPVDDIDGNHLINIGHDILLNKLFGRVFNDHIDGAYNYIFRNDGRLIAHPHYVEEIRNNKGVLNTSDLPDTLLKHRNERIISIDKQNSITHFIFYSDLSDAFIAVAKINGPDWYFVTVFPKELLATPAKKTARYIFILGLVSLVIELIMLLLVLREKVVKPLNHFKKASNRVGEGNYNNLDEILYENMSGKHSNEIEQVAETFVDMADHINKHNQTLEEKIEARTKELEKARLEAEELARTDPLTSLDNRRAFFELGKFALLNAKRSSHNLSLIMLDIDHFKNINDNYGHAKGDEVLKKLSETLQKNSRASDLVARLGGEEFVLLLTGSTINETVLIAEKLRQEIKQIYIPVKKENITFTASFGVAQLSNKEKTLDDLLAKADSALYAAKNSGRDCIKTT